ncbi:hypothetical protein ES703_89885 [subsurface metagenome]
MDELLEKLAALEHEKWSGWTEYMLKRLGYHPNSSNVWVRRWYRQIATPYSELSQAEKESDRLEARKVLEVIKNGFK